MYEFYSTKKHLLLEYMNSNMKDVRRILIQTCRKFKKTLIKFFSDKKLLLNFLLYDVIGPIGILDTTTFS